MDLDRRLRKDLDRQRRKDRLIINGIVVMRASRHPNILHYIDSFLHKHELWLVMEHMEGGSLMEVLYFSPMNEGQIAAVSREMCQGLEYLHSHGVIHRDIKSHNVLFSLQGNIRLGALIIPIEGAILMIFCSGFWVLCAGPRRCKENVDGWHTLLVGSRSRDLERVWAQSRHLEPGDCSDRCVNRVSTTGFN
jgi:serine/threonine protein kinase